MLCLSVCVCVCVRLLFMFIKRYDTAESLCLVWCLFGDKDHTGHWSFYWHPLELIQIVEHVSACEWTFRWPSYLMYTMYLHIHNLTNYNTPCLSSFMIMFLILDEMMINYQTFICLHWNWTLTQTSTISRLYCRISQMFEITQ